jgi:transposase-like protein
MKKQRLVREVHKIARTHGVSAGLVRQGKHEVWECAGLTFPIPRHLENR